jgi:hypothetical protein
MDKIKKKRGRPTKYKPELCDAIIKFFDVEPYIDKEIPHYKDGEVKWSDFKRVANRLPTLIRFAKSKKIAIRTIYDWVDKKSAVFQPEFLRAFTQAKRLQKEFLIENGLNGCYNPLFAKFVCINLTDMEDKPAVDASIHYHVTYAYRTTPKPKQEETHGSRINDSSLRQE